MTDTIVRSEIPGVDDAEEMKKVVYLFGAGASHGSVEWSGSKTGILMKHLAQDISESIHKSVAGNLEYSSESIKRIINDAIDPKSDVEQVITFLEDSKSPEHHRLAEQLRNGFRKSLSNRLNEIEEELNFVPAELYAVLIDLHLIPEHKEKLTGIITLNYDNLIEHAICSLHGMAVDYGIHVGETVKNPDKSILLIKLHGSFDWSSEWPITISEDVESVIDPLWIPPGIQKAKGTYPFNLLWGKAHELLECDIFRIVGCNLSANDWDLISLLFRTKHGHKADGSFEIELIDKPRKAREIQNQFPYLKINTMIDIDGIGESIVSEMLDKPFGLRYEALDEEDQSNLIEQSDDRMENPFVYWLRLKAEQVAANVNSVETNRRHIVEFLNRSN